MEIIEKKLKQLEKTVLTLKKVIELESKNTDPENIHRDAKIKRFEYTSELFWKFLKIYLERIHGVKAATPKSAYREALIAEIISPEETKQCIKMVETRNMTSHLYNEDIAQKIALEVNEYFVLIHTITKRISQALTK